MLTRFSFVLLLAWLVGLPLLPAQEVDAVIAPVTFSLPDQTFTDTLVLELRCETEAAQIRYATNGHPFTVFNSKTYSEPLKITETTWIRAQAFTADGTSVTTSGHFIRLAEDVQGFESPLPILVLENFGQGAVPSKKWNQTGAGVQQVARQRAQWFLFDRGAKGVSALGGEPHASDRIGVRVRGAFSSSFPRKPFSVEAWDENDAAMNIEPLGMPAESDWILYPPNAEQDRTLLYNTWLYELSRSLGGNAVRFRFTEAFVHTGGGSLSMADHAGVYVMMEKVKRDANRLDFSQLSEDGTQGGWLLSINRMDPIPVDGFPAPNGATKPQFFHTAGPNRMLQTEPNGPGRGDDIPRQSNAFINFESPNGYSINAQQRAAIEGWFDAFEEVLYGPDFRDPEIGYARYLDVDNFIDYFILHDITRNTDGLLISMWVYKEGPEAKLKMGPVWDYDLAYRDAAGSNLRLNQDRLWYARLWQDPNFEQRYIDRWQALRAGPMSDESIRALIDKQAAEITEPVAQAHGASGWPGRLTTWKKWLTDRAAATDKLFEPRPSLSLASAHVEPGATLRLSAGSIFSPKNVYYTSTGADPRLADGSLSPDATLFALPIVLNKTTRIRARVLNGKTWSGLTEGWYFVDEAPASAETLQISKIHYHPSDPSEQELAAGLAMEDDDFEFVELTNIGSMPIHLGGVRFADGIAFAFDASPMRTMSPKERVLIVRNQAAFALRYGNDLPIAGEYDGKLSNAGERLQLLGFNNAIIADITYNDRKSWPKSADGDGPSLVRIAGEKVERFAWRPSRLPNGAPAADDRLTFDGDPVGLLRHGLGTPSSTAIVLEDKGDHWRIGHCRNLAAEDVSLTLESSTALETWQALDGLIQTERDFGDDGRAMEWFEIQRPVDWKYLRLRATLH